MWIALPIRWGGQQLRSSLRTTPTSILPRMTPNLPSPTDHGTGAADVRMRRLDDFAEAELITGRFADFRFRRHAHERLVVAALTRGCMRISRPDGHTDVGRDTLITFNPDLVHWGGAVAADGWDVRQFHVDHATLVELAREMELPVPAVADGFAATTLRDAALARDFVRAHRCFDAPGEELEGESRMLDVLVRAFGQDARRRGGGQPAAPESSPTVRCALEFLDAHFARNVSLAELAAASGISRCHLVREFTKTVGMPPHAWLVHRRVREGERLLRRGYAPAETALVCGFADQAHFTRAFKAANGVTPARFRAALR